MSRILLVDDDEDIHLIIKAVIGVRAEYDISYTYSGSEALKIVKNNPPDLILLDYLLPDYDGKSLMAEFRKNENLDDTLIVFLTGKNDPFLMDELLTAGATSVISKPFTVDHLADEISTALKEN